MTEKLPDHYIPGKLDYVQSNWIQINKLQLQRITKRWTQNSVLSFRNNI